MKIISLNIERDRHYARWLPWIHVEAPDVVCLQEVYEEDLAKLAADMGLVHFAFVPLTKHEPSPEGRVATMGQAILAKAPLQDVRIIPYAGEGTGREPMDSTTPAHKVKTSLFALLVADVAVADAAYRVATTHFIWTPDGQADDLQRAACTRLLDEVSMLGEVVLMGDFNAPRGREIGERFRAALTDHVPAHYINSVDKALHRNGDVIDDLMVDYLFTTPGYVARNVRLQGGVSDHMGLVGHVDVV